MHRRPLGRARILVLAAAAILVVGCLLPWYRAGEGLGLPPVELRAFDGAGIVVFLVALATIALVALPYASDRPVPLDRPASYLVLFLVGAAGAILWPIDVLATYPAGLLPDRAPGYWLAWLGLAIYARAVYECFGEPPRG
ncbi:MAG: hypothetical protein C4343_01760 [Chloroflexota bacterium]